MSNLTFDLKCIRANPQSGICESEQPVSCCDFTYAQSTAIQLPPSQFTATAWFRFYSIIQRIGNLCHLTLSIGLIATPVPNNRVGTLPVGFRPSMTIGPIPAVLSPSNTAITVTIDTAGDINASINLMAVIGQILTLDTYFLC